MRCGKPRNSNAAAMTAARIGQTRVGLALQECLLPFPGLHPIQGLGENRDIPSRERHGYQLGPV